MINTEMKLIYPAHSKHFFFFRQHISLHVLKQGCVPLNPFMIFEYFMLDTIDRDVIRNANNNLVKRADEIWIFGPISDGVLEEIRLAKKHNKIIRYFEIVQSKEIKSIDPQQAILEENVKKYQFEII